MTEERLRRHIEGLPERQPIQRRSLLDLGPPEEVDSALKTLVNEGTLMRATGGVFGKPVRSEFGTWIGFGAWEAAKAFCENEGFAIGHIPATFANALHLSTQVVAASAYYTAGPTAEVPFEGDRTIHLIHASPRDMRLTQTVGGGAVLGLEWERPPYPLIAVRGLAKDLSRDHFADFLVEAGRVSGWIGKAAAAYMAAFGPPEEEDPMDLEGEGGRDLLDRAFAKAFRRHDERREAWTEVLNRHLAPEGPAGEGDGHGD